MKIILLGSNGMLGSDLYEDLKLDHPILIPFRYRKHGFDITNREQVMYLANFKPDVIINASAYTKVDKCELNTKESKKAFLINGLALINLCELAKKSGAVLVHYSTDYVFNGKNSNGYREDSVINCEPVNVYGKSKLLGEQIILNYAMNLDFKFYLIRTSWLFGANGNNFVKKMIYFAKNSKDEIKVVSDQYGRPTYTKDLANQTKFLLENKYTFGIYHITNRVFDDSIISWYEFAEMIFEQAILLKIIKEKPRITPITSDELNSVVKRPKYSILINTKLPEMRNTEEALREYLSLNF